MCTDDHRGRHVGLIEYPAPLRDSLTVTGEDNRFGRIRWNVHRDLPSTLVREHLGDQLSGDGAGGLACLLLHGLALIYRTLRGTRSSRLATAADRMARHRGNWSDSSVAGTKHVGDHHSDNAT